MRIEVKAKDLMFIQEISKTEIHKIEAIIDLKYSMAMKKLNPFKRIFVSIRNSFSFYFFLNNEYPWLFKEDVIDNIIKLRRTILYFKCISDVRINTSKGLAKKTVVLNDEEIKWFTWLADMYLEK